MRGELQTILDEIQLLSSQHSRSRKAAERIVALSSEALGLMKDQMDSENRAVEELTEGFRKLDLGIYDGHAFFNFSLLAEMAIEEAIRDLKRAANSTKIVPQAPLSDDSYVAQKRLSEIRSLPDDKWDFSKLNQLCVELNAAHKSNSHYATAMLVRAITDHIPPLFDVDTFGQLASQVGTRSFKETMQHLDKGLRKIADGYLHQHIRRRESLPTQQQANFSAVLDLLLSEVIIQGRG